jgi:hypothetical protein
MFRKLKNQIQETVTEKLKSATTQSPNEVKTKLNQSKFIYFFLYSKL